MPDKPPVDLGGLSIDEYLAPRPGEVSRAQPRIAIPPSSSSSEFDWGGYAKAAGIGAAGAAPLIFIPGVGWSAPIFGAAGGLIQHAVERNVPQDWQLGGWLGPIAGAAVAPWSSGGRMIASGAVNAARQMYAHPLSAAIGTGAFTGAVHMATGGIPAAVANLSNHIYETALVGLGIPTATAALTGGAQVLRQAAQRNFGPLADTAAGAIGAGANMLSQYAPSMPTSPLATFSPIYNLLSPPPTVAEAAIPPNPMTPPRTAPAAEAPIPLRPPEQRPQLPPQERTRLTIDPPAGYQPSR